MEKEKKTKHLPISKLKDIAWKNFSRYIRAVRDKGVCYTCGVKLPWSSTQCGHYLSRVQSGTFLDERNNHCQCANCNMWKKGNEKEYARRLVRDYGPTILDDLHELNKRPLKRTHGEWQDLIVHYETKLIDAGIKPAFRPPFIGG